MKQFNQNNHPKKLSKKKDKAYFTTKSELLSWINSTLDLNIKGIEQTITGAIFCQLLDAAHPGTVRMNKVNWRARLETEYISNFKIFQQALLINNIDKPIDINRLSKGKTQELIELLQWLYGHHISLRINPANYDAKKKRNGQNFIFSTEKGNNNINTLNNRNIRDDLSQCSSSTNFREYQMRNNLKNKHNINNLNANLRGNNFHTKYSNQKHIDQSNLKNKNKTKETNSRNNISSNHSRTLSASSSIDNIEDNNLNTKTISNINDNATNPFVIKEQPEENLKEDEEKKLNDNLFEGISNVDKENILEMEKSDGYNILELKLLLRKLRVNDVMFRNNLGNILNKIKREREFYLNKLKDIEYLYFNPVIQNKNEDKNNLLKTILSSKVDTSLYINEEGIASIIDKENNYIPAINALKNENNNKISNKIEGVNENKNIFQNNNNGEKRRQNSKNEIAVKYVFSKSSQNIINVKTGTNRTQPNANISNKNNDSNIKGLFSIQNDILKSNNNKGPALQKENNLNNITKNNDYNISSLIFNESLHIPNNENAKPNFTEDINLI